MLKSFCFASSLLCAGLSPSVIASPLQAYTSNTTSYRWPIEQVMGQPYVYVGSNRDPRFGISHDLLIRDVLPTITEIMSSFRVTAVKRFHAPYPLENGVEVRFERSDRTFTCYGSRSVETSSTLLDGNLNVIKQEVTNVESRPRITNEVTQFEYACDPARYRGETSSETTADIRLFGNNPYVFVGAGRSADGNSGFNRYVRKSHATLMKSGPDISVVSVIQFTSNPPKLKNAVVRFQHFLEYIRCNSGEHSMGLDESLDNNYVRLHVDTYSKYFIKPDSQDKRAMIDYACAEHVVKDLRPN